MTSSYMLLMHFDKTHPSVILSCPLTLLPVPFISKIVPMLQSYLFDFGDPVNSTRVAHRSMDTTLVVITLRTPQFWLLPPTVDLLVFRTVRHTFL